MVRLLYEEYLDEMATVYRSEKYNILVQVNPDSKRGGNAYFKFYNTSSYSSATKVIRILFKKCDYVYHTDKFDLWKLKAFEKKILMKILQEESPTYENISVWEAAKYDWNREYLEELISLPKYLNGYYDEKYKNNPGYVSSILEMPDYTKLVIK